MSCPEVSEFLVLVLFHKIDTHITKHVLIRKIPGPMPFAWVGGYLWSQVPSGVGWICTGEGVCAGGWYSPPPDMGPGGGYSLPNTDT